MAVDELDLLVLGDMNPDIIVSGVKAPPRFDQVEQLVDTADLVVGGSAAITAMGAARLGLKVGLCAVAGRDRFGEFMVDELQRSGVGTDPIRVERGLATGVTVILLSGQDRAILTAPGSISDLGPNDLADLPDRPARHVHVASYYLMNDKFQQALPSALQRFRAAGATVSIDTNWDPQERWQLDAVLQETDVFLPNRAELAAIAGTDVVTDAMAKTGSDSVAMVTKLGEWGAVARTRGQTYSVRAARQVGFVDSVGAGDTFNAGYLTGLLGGRDINDCLRLAVAAATLSTGGRGGTSAQPTLSEADALAAALTVSAGYEEPA